MDISAIGLDLAKNVFQVHAVSETGEVVIRKTLRRSQLLPFPASRASSKCLGIIGLSAKKRMIFEHSLEETPS
jgi:hypothetical protein